MPEPTTTFSPALSVAIPQGTLLLVAFLSILAIYIVYTVILHYHWRQFSANHRVMWLTFAIFAGLTLPLLIILGLTALAA